MSSRAGTRCYAVKRFNSSLSLFGLPVNNILYAIWVRILPECEVPMWGYPYYTNSPTLNTGVLDILIRPFNQYARID